VTASRAAIRSRSPTAPAIRRSATLATSWAVKASIPAGFTHAILTRFSIRAYPGTPPFSVEWLEHRMELFETYCLPSLAAQTRPDFAWLVFCDATTDTTCLARLRSLSGDVPQLRVVIVTHGCPAYRAAVAAARPRDHLLVTTRIDSDDASSTDLVARVQEYVPAFLASSYPAALLAFSRGLKWCEKDAALHATWNPHSPHLTLFERLDGQRVPVTVQSGNHGFMQERYPLHVDAGPPVWLQVLHGGNVSNHLHALDVPCDTALLGGRFAFRARPAGAATVAAPQPDDAGARAAFRQALEVGLLGAEGDRLQQSP
jgi:hypothetical protein